MEPITRFRGEHRFLSNMYPAHVTYEGQEYATVEHAYVAAKTLDPELRQRVKQLGTPSEAKLYGRTLTLRPDWDEARVGIMKDLVRQKFQAPDLMGRLLATGSVDLIEGNTWGDTFWGCIWEDVPGWVGENNLGKILMEVRQELRQ